MTASRFIVLLFSSLISNFKPFCVFCMFSFMCVQSWPNFTNYFQSQSHHFVVKPSICHFLDSPILPSFLFTPSIHLQTCLFKLIPSLFFLDSLSLLHAASLSPHTFFLRLYLCSHAYFKDALLSHVIMCIWL